MCGDPHALYRACRALQLRDESPMAYLCMYVLMLCLGLQGASLPCTFWGYAQAAADGTAAAGQSLGPAHAARSHHPHHAPHLLGPIGNATRKRSAA